MCLKRETTTKKKTRKKLKFIFMQHINFDFSARAMFVLVFIVRTCACWSYEICTCVFVCVWGVRVCRGVRWHLLVSASERVLAADTR